MEASTQPNELIQRYLDGGISASDLVELDRLLVADPTVAAEFARAAEFDSLLETGLNEQSRQARLNAFLTQFGPTAELAPRKRTARVVRFLGNLRQLGTHAPGIRSSLAMVLALFSTIALVLLLAVFLVGHGLHVVGNREAAQPQALEGNQVQRPQDAASSARSVARLARVNDCRWNGAGPVPQTGDALTTGQTFELAEGMVELRFEVGVKAILQGPAVFELRSDRKMALRSGKLTAEILHPEARGFEVETPKGKVVDLGTEFGVEVSRSQDVQVHVFKGEVLVQKAAAARRLTAEEGLRLEEGDPEPLLVKDTGDCFVRDMEWANRDRHVVAYWRFEDHPIGEFAPTTEKGTRPVRGTVDSSYNGNDLFAYSAGSRPRFSGEVATEQVPQSGQPNQGSLENAIHPSGVPTREMYTMSAFSHAAPLDLQKIMPEQWTIEVSVRPHQLHPTPTRNQTFVGRDGADADAASPRRSPLYFQIDGKDRFVIMFGDPEKRYHSAVASRLKIQEDHWYHLAAVSDGQTLRLYVDSLDGQGYVLEAARELPKTGSTALAKTGDDFGWTVGRGMHNRHSVDWFEGWIDEVRISDIARSPSEFLFSRPASRAEVPVQRE